MDSYGRVLKTVEEEKKEEDPNKPITDSYGRVLKPVEPVKEKKEVKMINTKKMGDDIDPDAFKKHESFDGWLYDQKSKIKKNDMENDK